MIEEAGFTIKKEGFCDIWTETQMKRMERQATRADEYARLMTHLDGLLRVWYGYRWGQGQLQLREGTARLRESDAAVEAQRRRLVTLEGEIGELRAEQTELRAKLGTWYTTCPASGPPGAMLTKAKSTKLNRKSIGMAWRSRRTM